MESLTVVDQTTMAPALQKVTSDEKDQKEAISGNV